MNVKIGTEFRYHHADGNPLWRVIEKRGRGTWLAQIVDGEDFARHQQAFTTEAICGSIHMANYWQKSQEDSDTFFQRLPLNGVVHYRNAGGCYVRCKVTPDHQLMPIALVGKWMDHDLPRRMYNGEIHLGYHAKNIVEAKPFRPHASNVWEYQHDEREQTNPSTLPVVSLEVPPMTPEQEQLAHEWRTVDLIRNIVSERQGHTPRGLIQNVISALDNFAASLPREGCETLG